MKATGASIHEFYTAGWPKDYYHDDYVLEFYTGSAPTDDLDDGWALEADVEYDLDDCGWLYHNSDDISMTFEEAYTAWLKAQTCAVVAVIVPHGDVDALKALAADKGWEIKA